MSDTRTIADELKVLENAVGIVQLRLAFPNDEWAKRKGDELAKGFTTKQLLAHIAATAVSLISAIEDDEA